MPGSADSHHDGFHDELTDVVAGITSELTATHHAREKALPACRRVIRSAGSSIRSSAWDALEAPGPFSAETAVQRMRVPSSSGSTAV